MRARSWRVAALASLPLLLAASAADAHEFQPSLLELRAIGAGRYEVDWKPSSGALGGAALAPGFPSRCHRLDAPEVAEGSGPARFLLDCGSAGLAGAEIRV